MAPAAWAPVVILLAFTVAVQAGPASYCAVNTTGSNPGWGRFCAFPYETCATNPGTSMYTASPTKYYQSKGQWVQCLQIVVLDQGTCRQRAGYPKNATRCCDTILNKLKLNARRACWGSVASYTVQRSGQPVTPPLTSFVWESVGPGKKQAIVKFTPLKLTPATADSTEICITLRAPCTTISAFTGGKPLQYALYDKKAPTVYNGVKSASYECCPTNSFPISTN